MAKLGPDLVRLRGPLLYDARPGTGLWIGVALVLGLILAYVIVQFGFGNLAAYLLYGDVGDAKNQIKGMIIATLPAGLFAAVLAYYFASVGDADARAVLALRWPRLTGLGWVVVLGGFVIGMYMLAFLIMFIFNIDPAQYTPKPDGSSPDTGSAGLVKEAMFALANSPGQYWLAVLSVSIGAPLAEELMFRGQLFAVLSRTWLAKSGTVIVTSALWAAMHMTEPLFSVGLIFAMGLLLGALLLRFGSIYVTMMCHSVWNAVFSLIILGGQ